jgi:2-hydroxy-6-oxonona-2,4-dienedioate hydrolase
MESSMAGMVESKTDAQGHFAEIQEVEARAQRFETPCGDGSMVWHKWGNGPPLLMLHGGSGSWMHWLRQIPVLESHHTVWAADLPGMGDSDLPHQPYEPQPYADVVLSGLEKLSPGAGSIDVAGFSFGAGLAARIACRLTGRIRHLVISGANYYVPEKMVKRENFLSLKRFPEPAERMRAVRNNLQVMMVRHDHNIDDLAIHIYNTDTLRRRLPRVSFSGFTTLRADLAQVTLSGRLTAISGADDQIIGHDPEGQRAQLLSIRPEAQYISIPGAGHWVMYEGAAGYNAALMEALAD